MNPEHAARIRKIEETSNAIRPLLAGLGPEIQGSVLADLTSMWLAGFQGPDAEIMRQELLQAHIALVETLIPVNEIILFFGKGETRQ